MQKSRLVWALAAVVAMGCSTSTTPPVAGPELQSSTADVGPQGAFRGVPAEEGQPVRGTRRVLIDRGIPTTSRCYTLSTERAIFKVLWVDSDERSDWDAAATGVANECEGTAKWDDQWYWYYLPPDRTHNLMLLWKNIDAKEYGYVVIKNTPTLWLVYTNNGGPWNPKNGEQIKRTWHTDGKRIDIDVRNPKNEGDWTANDIWVSFGF